MTYFTVINIRRVEVSILLFLLMISIGCPLNQGYKPLTKSFSLRGMKNNSFQSQTINNARGISPMRSQLSQISRNVPSTKLFANSAFADREKEDIMKVESEKLQRAQFPWRKLGLVSLSLLAILLAKSPVAHAMNGEALDVNSLINAWNLRDSGFLQSFLLIFVSEIGDKTFFIAALLAAKYGRLVSFTGSIAALAAMTLISTVIGQLFHAVPSSISKGVPFDDYIAVAAFAYFGIKTLIEASKIEPGKKSGIEEEKEEAEELVEGASNSISNKKPSFLNLILQTFSLVFAAEIGDRSFLSTIALSAALNPVAVASGALAGHTIATGVAVLGGAFMSQYLSERVIGYIGGSLFIIFAITTALGLF